MEVLTDYPMLHQIWNIFDDDFLDRDWVVRNVLGGMAAGFGLRGESASSVYTASFI